MLSVISPAKKLNFEKVLDVKDSTPKFQNDANYLAEIARKLSVTELKNLMKISEDLAILNQKRFQSFSNKPEDYETKQAALAFSGDTYTGLDAGSLTSQELSYAQEHLRILSGLYGVLRPLDRIQPYRLEMGRKIATNSGNTLYAYWGDRIGNELDLVSDGAVINLASNEYFKAVGKNMKSRIITPSFKEDRSGELKMIGFFAKKARGAMARFMIKNNVQKPEDLKNFNTDGYNFQPELSDNDNWIFTRKTA